MWTSSGTCSQWNPPRPTVIRQWPYCVSEVCQQPVEKTVEQVLRNCIIEESINHWSSPIVAVPKPDGSLWICNDFQRLNQIAEFERYPLPQVDDLMNCLGRVRFILILDLTKGYWQVALTPEARPKTAFSNPSGHHNLDFDQPFTEDTNAS